MRKLRRVIQHKRVPKRDIDDYPLGNNSEFLSSLVDEREENRILGDLSIVQYFRERKIRNFGIC
jgi:hypothetical protein